MQNLGVFLEVARCPEGVELAPLPDDPHIEAFQARSARRRREDISIANLENPLVVRFVNATTDAKRSEFFARFGLLNDSGVTLESVQVVQRNMLRLLTQAGSGDPVAARRAVDVSLARTKLSLSLQMIHDEPARIALMMKVDGLDAFMRLEAAMVAINGARFTTCQHCGDAFLTGPLTGRRSHAKYCSDKHRVAAMRARRAAEEGQP
jgi:hypothetical protein